ncbi:MAG: DUF938 domain-containing protein [Granulosicoccus sp.]
MNKPFSPSADRNKEPILGALRHELADNQQVLEIGSGTGQHACFFAAALPSIRWQPTELKQNIPAIQRWISEQPINNVLPPKELDVDVHPWPIHSADVCYTCNTFHIVSAQSVKNIYRGCKALLGSGGKLCVYGPFSIDGQHNSAGNESFDQQLRASNPDSGIRDLSQLDEIAQQSGFSAYRCTKMPANNLFVVWEIQD